MENFAANLTNLKDVTTLNSFGLCFLLLVSILILFLPRRFALVPIILTICYCTLGQVIAVATLDFSILRILILLGWVRLIVRRELFPFKLSALDKAIILWVISGVSIYVLLWQTWGALIYRLGFAYNTLGSYFLFRFLIRDLDDIYRLIKILAVVAIPLAGAMAMEKATGRNLFSIFGGVWEVSEVRTGKVRCCGPFGHPILAGTFGATLLPLLVPLLYMQGGVRLLGIGGILSATIITLTSASSGPIMSYLAGIIGFCIWPFRKRMRAIRWAILFSVMALGMVMKSPVWYLPARIAELTGGSGWYRSYLIDQAIAHFGEWWLMGTKYTADWTPFKIDPNTADITCQYVAEGVHGGLLTLILFVSIFFLSFRNLGQLLWKIEEQTFVVKITFWSMGVALFVHVVSLISISYFDQLSVSWILLLAMISTTSYYGDRSEVTSSELRI
jgi:hypothetical protein